MKRGTGSSLLRLGASMVACIMNVKDRVRASLRRLLQLWMGRDGRHFAASQLLLILAPTQLRLAVRNRNHGDAFIHRTDQRAEVAANALMFLDLRNRFAGHATRTESMAIWIDQRNRLVSAVLAGDVTKVATDAFIIIDPRYALVM